MSEERKLPFIKNGKELMSLTFETPRYVSSGLLRLGRRRMSLLTAKPKSGKSTFARQLAVAVSKGIPFLGFETLRGEVLYWQTEDDAPDVQEAYKRLGYDPSHDAEINTFTGRPTDNTLENLRDVLEAHPEIVLVILETVDDILKFTDIKENTAARIAFDKFDTLIMSRFSSRVAFLGLHHLKKRENDARGDMILGASVIRGRSDAELYIERVSDDDERRIFHANVRVGEGIPPTYLNYDPKTGMSALGMTVREERKAQVGVTNERIHQDIIMFFANHPDSKLDDCLAVVGGHRDTVRQVAKKAVMRGLLTKSGKAVKGSPVLYRVNEIPREDTPIPVKDAA
jgi:hypothetical protein